MSELALPVDQQRAEAPGMLGASDAAAALGLDPYRPPIAVWRQARGLTVPDERPAFVQEAAEWGQILEPVIRGKYALATSSAVLVPNRSRIHPLRDWLRATPDGIVLPMTGEAGELMEAGLTGPGTWSEENVITGVVFDVASTRGLLGLLQVKTCSAFIRHEWEERPPPRYEVQVRVEMAVTGLPWCDVVCLVGGQHYAGPFRVHRDLGIEELILGDLDEFHRKIVDNIEPELDGSEAWREHISEKLLKAAGTIEAPTAEMLALLGRWREERKAAAQADATAKATRNEILLRMSAAGATRIKIPEGGAVTAYRPGARTDWKRYALSLGGTEAGSRVHKGEPGAFALRAPSGWGDDE